MCDGTPDHECDERCRPHQCRPAEPATIVQIHNSGGALTLGVYAHRTRPVDQRRRAKEEAAVKSGVLDQVPGSPNACQLLRAAAADSTELGAFVRLALVSGSRPGELLEICWSDLRWPDVP